MATRRFLVSGILCCMISGAGFGAEYFVAIEDPQAADANPGTEAEPFKTISKALEQVKFGDTVIVKNGTYRESVVWMPEGRLGGKKFHTNETPRTTLKAFAGHKPVIKGSEIVKGPWEKAKVALRKKSGQDDATGKKRGPADAWLGTRGVDGAVEAQKTPDKTDALTEAAFTGIYTCSWENTWSRKDGSYMAFADGRRLDQIGIQGSPKRFKRKNQWFVFVKSHDGQGPEDMRPGSFFHDAKKKLLYVWLADSSHPKDHTIEASVRAQGVRLQGTWTVNGITICHVQDDMINSEAISIHGKGVIIDSCRILHNDYIGIIVQGDDTIFRKCEFAHNGLNGIHGNLGTGVLVENNVFHDNSWRGDVRAGGHANKLVLWKDSKFIGNHFYNEKIGLWLDINVLNVLVADNLFENCNVGLYYEISRWGIIVNNVFRNCGRGIWSNSSDVLIANNVLEGCGEGITVTGVARWCSISQGHKTLMAVRNNLIVNNIIINSSGHYIGMTKESPYCEANVCDYNVFVWTLPAVDRMSNHIKFMAGWDDYYARLSFWRQERHFDLHSIIVDPKLFRLQSMVWRRTPDLIADPGFVDQAKGDYRLKPGSALQKVGVQVPLSLASVYRPGAAPWAKTLVSDAGGDPAKVKVVCTTGKFKHARYQPKPAPLLMFDPAKQSRAAPGLVAEWTKTRNYPAFQISEEKEEVTEDAASIFTVVPESENMVKDPQFTGWSGKVREPWVRVSGNIHGFANALYDNLQKSGRSGRAYQTVGKLKANTKYALKADMRVHSMQEKISIEVQIYLAVGSLLKPIGPAITVTVKAKETIEWKTYQLAYVSGEAGPESDVGQDLHVVVSAMMEGQGPKGDPLCGQVCWDNFRMVSVNDPKER